MAATNSSSNVDTLEKFLQHDGEVLRFYGYWDDRENQFGYVHNMELHYFVGDDTIEIKEVISPHSSVMFSSRGRLPKIRGTMTTFGDSSSAAVLNVVGMGQGRSHTITDSRRPSTDDDSYYKDKDLAIGACINCYGRKLMLTDCDAFTKEYYHAHYGIDDFTPAVRPESGTEGSYKASKDHGPTRQLPPYHDYCSSNDPAATPKSAVLKSALSDKMMNEDFILRFRANLISEDRMNNMNNRERIFVISFYVVDGTVSVFENIMPNTGFRGGLFARRGRMLKPGARSYSGEDAEVYSKEDFFIGSVIVVNGFSFSISDADEYALHYMEMHRNQYPKSDIKLILKKLQNIKPSFQDFADQYLKSSDDSSGVVTYSQLKKAIMDVLGNNITEHELITIARQYNAHCKDNTINKEALRFIVHGELRKFSFNKFQRLLENLQNLDNNGSCYLDRSVAFSACRSANLPLDQDVVNAVLDTITTNEAGQLNYMDLMQFLDFKTCPTSPTVPRDHQLTLYNLAGPPTGVINHINYESILKDLDEEEFKEEENDVQ